MTKLKEELTLKEKLQILKDRAQADNQIDWEAEKEKWLVSVAKLYQTIEKWLEELVIEDYVQITQKTITVSEDQAGIYQIPQLEMAYGDKVAVLEPIAVDMPFAKGMIEFYLKGDKREGYALLLWKDDEDHDDWKFYNERALGPKISPFNHALFEETLENWLTQFLW
jgi:hypothetical protein